MEIRTITKKCHFGQLKNELYFPDSIANFPDDMEVWASCVENEQDVLSAAICMNQGNRRGQAQLLYIYTDPAYRRMGYSKLALAEMKKSMKDRGVRSIFCKVTGVSEPVQWWFHHMAMQNAFVPLLLDGCRLTYSLDKLLEDGCPLLHAAEKYKDSFPGSVDFVSTMNKDQLRALYSADLIRDNAIDLFDIRNQSEQKNALLYSERDPKSGQNVVLGYLELTKDQSKIILSDLLVPNGKHGNLCAIVLLYSMFINDLGLASEEHDRTLYVQSSSKKQTELYLHLLGEPERTMMEREYVMM